MTIFPSPRGFVPGRGEFPGFAGEPAGERPGRSAGGFGGFGGFGGGNATVSSAFAKLLESGASRYTWAAATNGARPAAPVALAASAVPVAPGGAGGPGGGSTDAAQISAWVQAHFTVRTVGGMTVYDLTAPVAGS